MRYLLPDNTVITGHSHADLVRAMSNQKMSTPRSLASYRRACARRMKGMLKPSATIDTSSNKTFIESLEKYNVIEPVK